MLDIKEIGKEIENFGFRNDLSKNEISHIIIITYSLVSRIQKNEDIINKIKDYCNFYEQNDRDSFLRNILKIIEEKDY